MIEELKDHSPSKFGSGVSNILVKDLEARLDIALPIDFKEYLVTLNYAELYGDPIFGINSDMKGIDLYSQNKHKEHFKYGFLYIFDNDIDGAIFLRPDTGAIYNACFSQPVAKNFFEFVKKVLSE